MVDAIAAKVDAKPPKIEKQQSDQKSSKHDRLRTLAVTRFQEKRKEEEERRERNARGVDSEAVKSFFLEQEKERVCFYFIMILPVHNNSSYLLFH